MLSKPVLLLFLAIFCVNPASLLNEHLVHERSLSPVNYNNSSSNKYTLSLTPFIVQQLQKFDNGSSNTYKSASKHFPTPSNHLVNNNANSQHLLNLMRKLDARLLIMRNVEMSITTIQEIFDSIGLSSSRTHSSDNGNLNDSTLTTTQILQTFCTRLSEKLDTAKNVVMELRDFFHRNISVYDSISSCNKSIILKIVDSKLEVREDEKKYRSSNASCDEYRQKLFLTTYISQIQDDDTFEEESPNYREQTKTLNYIKEEKKTLYVTNDLGNNSLNANFYIVSKIRSLRALLSSNFASSPLQLPKKKDSTTKTAHTSKTNLKHIYFLSRNDNAASYGNKTPYSNDILFRQLYVSAILKKFVFLLVDMGAALSAEQFNLTKAFVSNVINLLSNEDLITIVTVSNEAKSVQLNIKHQSSKTFTSNVCSATRDCKEELLKYIEDIEVSNKFADHIQGFEYAFKSLEVLEKANFIDARTPIVFVYVSRGYLPNLSDAMHVLAVIAKGQRLLRKPIVINTCAVISEEKPLMYQKEFLRDIAQQNYSKYDVNWHGNQTLENLTGSFFVITKKHSDILHTSTSIFGPLFQEQYLAHNLVVHEPVLDKSSSDLMVSFTQAIPSFGVVGVNLYLSDLVEDVVNYIVHENTFKHSFAFIIDLKGYTIAHPAFPNHIAQSETPFPVDIGLLENSTDFVTIRHEMLHKTEGNFSTTILSRGNNAKPEIMNRSYIWRRVLEIYIICIVTTSKRYPFNGMQALENDGNLMPLQLSPTVPITMQVSHKSSDEDNIHHTNYLKMNDLLYHRLDLISPHNAEVCRYFRQVATFDAGTIYLSTSAFESPFAYLQNNQNCIPNFQIRTIESIMAYLKDTTGLLANPGLRPNVRNEVKALFKAMRYLKKRHQNTRGTLKNYIIRRYIATVNGVMHVYPGCLMTNNFDPTSRSWFRKAIQHSGKIVATSPYLDAGGAGYIITIANTIFESKSKALHSNERVVPVAIVALDLPYTFFYKLIVDSSPFCSHRNVKCLLFENKGYLVAHPSMLEPSTKSHNQRRPNEHLTHKESFLANDILYHKTLVKKFACANYQSRTIKRYYEFNTSLTEILTNVVHTERSKYIIARIGGSNIFAAILNSTCDGGAFCPCSTIDSVCLNCNRMDQTDCECPCECPMHMKQHPIMLEKNKFNEYPSIFRNYTTQYSYCEPTEDEIVKLPTIKSFNLLHSCFNINCDFHVTQAECLANIGCEWCQLDQNGNQFTTSFCTSQLTCFNGVLSALNPYDDYVDDSDVLAVHVYNIGQKQNSYSTFGPVGGAIIVLSLLIGFAIYFYKHNNLDSNHQEEFYMNSIQEDNYCVQQSRFNFDNCRDNDEMPAGCDGNDDMSPFKHHNFIKTSNISPYHTSSASNYLRPPNGESDHGYSTMTPQEDFTDHQSFTLAEPLILSDKLSNKSDTISISTSISSPTNRHQSRYQNPYLHIPQGATKEISSSNVPLSKEGNFFNSIKAREQTMLLRNSEENIFYVSQILAPVTVHRHMETSGS